MDLTYTRRNAASGGAVSRPRFSGACSTSDKVARLPRLALTALAFALCVAISPAPAMAWQGTLISDAVSSWWARPTSTYQSVYGITYVTGVSSSGDWVWGAYDMKTGVATRQAMGRSRSDDHDTPAIIAPANRPPVVFYTGHNTMDVIWYRVSNQVGDWLPGPERPLQMPGKVTYVQVHQGRTADTLLLFTRCGDDWLLAVSNDYGDSWKIRPLFRFDSGAYGYVITAQSEDGTIRVAAGGHPDKTSMTTIRYCEIDPSGDIRATRSGEALANVYSGDGLPLKVSSDLPVIYRYPEGTRSRLFDVSTAPEPEVMLARWTGDGEAEYVYLKQAEGEWEATALVASGHPIGYSYDIRYLGGASFPNPTDGGDVYLSREAANLWKVEHWRHGESGWAPSLVTSSLRILARPSAPINASPQLPLLWLDLTTYDDYEHFNGSVVGLLPSGKPEPAKAGTPVAGDWDGDGRAEPGVFNAGTWTVRVGGEVSTFRFGQAGDSPLVGDWNGDGKDEIAVHRGRQWILSSSVGPVISATFVFGKAGDAAIVGDWNGDGVDGIGIRRGSAWYLRDKPCGGKAEISFRYGRFSDTPVAGDWTGSGRDGIGVKRGASWKLRIYPNGGAAQMSFDYGRSSDLAAVADWGGLGKDAPGVRRQGTGIWYVIDAAPGLPRPGHAPNRFLF